MLDDQRHLFNLRDGVHYLNCAYKSPLLRAGEEAAQKALVRERNPVEISTADFFTEVSETRAAFGRLVNCKPERVALVPSTSYAMATALKNVECEAGKHAVVVENEFPSGYFAVQRWCEIHQAEMKVVGTDGLGTVKGAGWNTRILDAINEQTALVLISSVHWMNGLRFDLAAIGEKCRSVGAKFIVDGTQSVGLVPTDVEAIQADALICAGYKWLLGPYSLCVAYFGPYFDGGQPIEESWMNRVNAMDFAGLTDYADDYRPGATRFSVGETSNFILTPILKAGLDQINIWTPAAMQAYCRRLSKPLYAYMESLGVPQEAEAYRSAHLCGLRLPASIEEASLKKCLAARQVYLSQRGDTLRVSINVFNTQEDVAALLAAVEEAGSIS